ncbi:LSU ribosomal protein L1P [Candidatus Nitrososphaera evergladensis SR1]|uniref:Large ribosomal subunit protein uL1 n=1 Tax=Candidatus Nitrososphaera evergladensis SR1 TaxID=1459636 RepID=A0A075MMX0_9ARCH|nr:50S ribosomal protein L1 [Candidatus Nitrososphaera evergladensis]AIF82791.1 LSU ribosomal protein L1P [Candidatus Nitrososphaera evergladensis SR1]
MVSDSQIKELVKRAREGAGKRNFSQSAELTLVLKDIDVKKGFNLNETVALPHKPSRQPTICVIAAGEMGMRAKKAGVEHVMEPEELSRLGTNKREARKLVRAHDFFLSDTTQMAAVGRSLGQFLGPKGKMPTPLPYGAPVEAIANRFRGSVRVKAKNQLNASTKIGDETLSDDQLVENANAVIAAVEKKLPQGDKNIKNVMVKFTMGKGARLSALKAADKKKEATAGEKEEQ